MAVGILSRLEERRETNESADEEMERDGARIPSWLTILSDLSSSTGLARTEDKMASPRERWCTCKLSWLSRQNYKRCDDSIRVTIEASKERHGFMSRS